MADGGRSNADIAMRLDALMKALEKKQVEFASLIGVSQPALNNYLKGLRRPDIDVAISIQTRTGATLDWIYLGDRSGLPVRLAAELPDLSGRAERAG
ncbi:helix-turn-helix domain-containing protein [Shinella sp. H4-D48]|uniref:helix-turn-helix domain-containing protein n=1 Tax=Shinella sp. H4-D48 TaxID=2925841 RepID=UPI00352C7E67